MKSREEREAETRAVWAQLISAYHYRPCDIARLTDRQIHDLCFHPRDEDGSVRAAEDRELRAVEPKSLAQELVNWECIAQRFMMKPEAVEEGRQKIRAKWAQKGESGHST